MFCLLLSFAGECILGHASSSPQHVTSPGAPSHSDPEFNDDSFFHNGSFMQTHREALGRRVSEHLVFVTEEESAVQSVEEVVYCTIYLTASLPLGLIGEIGFLLNRAVSLTLEIRSSWVKTADMLSSPAPEVPEGDTTGQDWQNFQFDFVVLPPQRGSAGVTYLLQVASEGSLLQTFKALVRESPSMKNVLISPFWVLLLPVPQVQEETVTRPTIFATWTSTEQPPIYIPAITTSPLPAAICVCLTTRAGAIRSRDDMQEHEEFIVAQQDGIQEHFQAAALGWRRRTMDEASFTENDICCRRRGNGRVRFDTHSQEQGCHDQCEFGYMGKCF